MMSAPNFQQIIDQNTTLCLACSSSLPPLKSGRGNNIFTTPCCHRPICPSCIESNPRLARYDPCLSCLDGVGLVSATIAKNVDGAVRDEDTYVVGDDDDDDEPEEAEPPADAPAPNDDEPSASSSSPPSEYWIKRADTLRGIALRFGVDGRELCRLNNLPPSTLSTTPHLLHTRVSLQMPPSVQCKLLPQDTMSETRRKNAQVSRATKRLQTLTKEVDWNVAKAYVALADDPHESEWKRKETGIGDGGTSLEVIAVESYLDDDEWEQQERREGRGVNIRPFPFSSFGEKH